MRHRRPELISAPRTPQIRRELRCPLLEQSAQRLRLPFGCCSRCQRKKIWRRIRTDRDVKSTIIPAVRTYSRRDCDSGVPKCEHDPISMNWPNGPILNYHLNARRYLLLRWFSLCVINLHLKPRLFENVRDLAFITDRFSIGCRRGHRDRSGY